MKKLLFLLLIPFLMGSCISQNEYDKLKKENEDLKTQLNRLGFTDDKNFNFDLVSSFLSENLVSEDEIRERDEFLKKIRNDYENSQLNGDGGVDGDKSTFEHNPDRGELYKEADLEDGIEKYEKWRDLFNQIGRNFFPKYFFFGKNKFKKFTDRVADYKPPSSDPKEKIAGYLVKLAFKPHSTYPNDVTQLDAILVPVNYNGKPIFEMSLRSATTATTYGSGFDDSAPCPDECP